LTPTQEEIDEHDELEAEIRETLCGPNRWSDDALQNQKLMYHFTYALKNEDEAANVKKIQEPSSSKNEAAHVPEIQEPSSFGSEAAYVPEIQKPTSFGSEAAYVPEIQKPTSTLPPVHIDFMSFSSGL